jgi:hypothetical protein
MGAEGSTREMGVVSVISNVLCLPGGRAMAWRQQTAGRHQGLKFD